MSALRLAGSIVIAMAIVLTPFVSMGEGVVVTIVRPTDGASVAAGSTVEVELQTSVPVDATAVMLSGSAFGSAYDNEPPYLMTLKIPREPGILKVIGLARISESAISDAISLSIVPSSALVSLNGPVLPVQFEYVGEEDELVIEGQYADNSKADLTAPATGTTYESESGTEHVVKVRENVVTAQGAGTDKIIVTNGGVSVTIPVTVAISNGRPALCRISDIGLTSGDSADVLLCATDPESQPLKFSVLGPSFVSLVDNGDGTGHLHLEPAALDEGSYNLSIRVADSGFPMLEDEQVVRVIIGSASIFEDDFESGTFAKWSSASP